MYVLGHLLPTRALSSVDRDCAQEFGIDAVMLPDVAESHAVTRTHAWEKEGDTDSRLIRSHIAGAGWMHFGDDGAEDHVAA